MFKRGEIVELNLKRMDGLIEVGILRDADYLISAHDGKVQSTAGYEMTKPPIHEKDGRRFVPSGEYREPLQDEWYLSGLIGGPARAVLVPLPHYPILLPVPELEPEHEFEVGDWVKDTRNGEVFCADESCVYPSKYWEKLPGRPLTTADLMQVLSGKKITVECHAECCVKGKGHPVSGGIIYNIFKHTTYFFHANQFHQVLPSAALAEFKDGSIVFAPNVEGNIFIVEAT